MNFNPRPIAPFPTRRALGLQPLPDRDLPAFRSQDGEFFFACNHHAAANDAIRAEFAQDKGATLNVPVLLVVIALVLCAIAVGAGLVLVTIHFFEAFARLVFSIPEPWVYAVPAAAVSLLCVVLCLCVRDYREGELA